MSKHNPITTRLYAITRDTFPAVEDQLIKLKSKSQETQRALLSAIASGIAMVEIVNVAMDYGIDIAPCNNHAKVLVRNLQGKNGTGIAREEVEGGEGEENKLRHNLNGSTPYSNSPKKIPDRETYASFGERICEMLEDWHEIELDDEEWANSYESYVLKNKEVRSDLIRLLKKS
tara:strand:- start:131 stop:652 length:522 start_codon:yes stop_codon:yes gene_type:complete